MNQDLLSHLRLIYGAEVAATTAERLDRMLADYQANAGASRPSTRPRVSHQDAILITYGDMVQAAGERPLNTLSHFLQNHLAGLVSAVHLLPFFPYSSDDGFSVIDYKAVYPDWGDWADVAQIGGRFRLMFDLVVNHTSVQCGWFQAFLRRERPYADFYVTADPDADLSLVFRPRTHPLLTPFATETGIRHVWTTFSADQVDLNFANPDVLLAMLDVLLFYVARGAEFIRLDAIAYVWKEMGTDCLHRPQAHEIVKLMRTILNQVAPHVSLITETNVPHAENIAYFGNGRDEAQLVYNFPLPPLTLHAFHTGNAEILSQWADSLTLPSDETTFFNFLASHDGIGVQPARGLLPDTAVTAMANRIKALGGLVNYKTNSDGSQSPYELNCTYLDALGDPDNPYEPIALKTQRFLAAQAIMLALRGVPGIYFHSLFGSQNWREGVRQTGHNRTINRQKYRLSALIDALADAASLRHQVFAGYAHLLRQRTALAAFAPQGDQQVLFCHPALFALWRISPDGRERLLCLHNVSNQPVRLEMTVPDATVLVNVLSGAEKVVVADGRVQLSLAPYAVKWFQPA